MKAETCRCIAALKGTDFLIFATLSISFSAEVSQQPKPVGVSDSASGESARFLANAARQMVVALTRYRWREA